MINPVVPLILVLELIRGLFYRKFEIISCRIPYITCLFNAVIGRFIYIGMVTI